MKSSISKEPIKATLNLFGGNKEHNDLMKRAEKIISKTNQNENNDIEKDYLDSRSNYIKLLIEIHKLEMERKNMDGADI